MTISFRFAWFDCWVGVYVDRERDAWYICPLPMCVIKVQWL